MVYSVAPQQLPGVNIEPFPALLQGEQKKYAPSRSVGQENKCRVRRFGRLSLTLSFGHDGIDHYFVVSHLGHRGTRLEIDPVVPYCVERRSTTHTEDRRAAYPYLCCEYISPISPYLAW